LSCSSRPVRLVTSSQRLPEPKTAKNRVHLDLRAAAGVCPEGARTRSRPSAPAWSRSGARRVRRLEADGINAVCIVMQDPEGNEFCLD
jgi:Glyoxalase-like domain